MCDKLMVESRQVYVLPCFVDQGMIPRELLLEIELLSKVSRSQNARENHDVIDLMSLNNFLIQTTIIVILKGPLFLYSSHIYSFVLFGLELKVLYFKQELSLRNPSLVFRWRESSAKNYVFRFLLTYGKF